MRDARTRVESAITNAEDRLTAAYASAEERMYTAAGAHGGGGTVGSPRPAGSPSRNKVYCTPSSGIRPGVGRPCFDADAPTTDAPPVDTAKGWRQLVGGAAQLALVVIAVEAAPITLLAVAGDAFFTAGAAVKMSAGARRILWGDEEGAKRLDKQDTMLNDAPEELTRMAISGALTSSGSDLATAEEHGARASKAIFGVLALRNFQLARLKPNATESLLTQVKEGTSVVDKYVEYQSIGSTR
jgi:hypothetical protein